MRSALSFLLLIGFCYAQDSSPAVQEPVASDVPNVATTPLEPAATASTPPSSQTPIIVPPKSSTKTIESLPAITAFPTVSVDTNGTSQISLLGTSCGVLDLSCVTGALVGASTRSGVPIATASGGSLAGENAGESNKGNLFAVGVAFLAGTVITGIQIR